MVFGWGKKRPVEAPARREVGLQDVPGIVADIESLRESAMVSAARGLREQTAPLVDDLAEIGRLLEKDDLDVDDVDKNIRLIVSRGRKQVIDTIKRGATPLPQVSAAEDVAKLDAALGQMLKKVGDVLGRQKRVIHLFSKKYAQQLKDGLAVMSANGKEIHVLVTEAELRRDASEGIRGLVRQVGEAESSLSAVRGRMGGAERAHMSLGTEIESLRESVAGARSSAEYGRYVKLQGDLGAHEAQEGQMRADAGDMFAKISRPLGRYRYGSSLDKEYRGLLDALVTDPYRALLPGNTDAIITILENVRKAITSGSISVKDVEKSLAHITGAEEALEGLVRRIHEHGSAAKRLRDEVESARPAKLEALERDLARRESLRDYERSKAESLRAEAGEIEARIPALVSDVERKLCALSNTKYVVRHGVK